MDALIQIGLVLAAIVAAVVAVVYAVMYVLAAIYCLLVSLCFAIFAGLDGIFGASLMPATPGVMWVVWGVVLGGAIGFWTIAPVYGLRKFRPAIMATPVVLMVVVAVIAGTTKGYGEVPGATSAVSSPSGAASAAPVTAGRLLGHWSGRFSRSNNASLNISQVKGNSFSGVLSLRYPNDLVKIAVSGQYDGAARTLSFHEKRFIQQPRTRHWMLGSDRGAFGSNADTISGKGSDSKNASYDWAFTKQG